jgi:hypothetical protein
MTGASTGKMSSSKIVMNEAAAKAAWLAKLDSPVFGKDRASPLSEPTYDAPAASMAASTSETAAKAAWLAKLDAPAWGHKAAPTNEAAAKAAWLAKLDAPAWGKGAAAQDTAQEVVQEAAPVFAPLDAIGKVVPNVPVIAWWMRSDTREVQFGRM